MTTPSGSPDWGANPRLLAVLAYLGGAITGIVLLVVEKRDPFVRFHAMQSVVTFLGVLVMHLVFQGLPVVGAVFYVPFLIVVVGLWVVLMAKAWRGESYKVPYAGDLAEHLLK